MISLKDWIMELSMDYGVYHIDDVESGTFVAQVNQDVYLVNHRGVKE